MRQHLPPAFTVYSHTLAFFNAVTMAGHTHQPTAVADRKPKDLPELQWTNTVLGNLKSSHSGIYHAFPFSKYALRYLGAFGYRFNLRFDLPTLPQRLFIALVRCSRRPEHQPRLAEE